MSNDADLTFSLNSFYGILDEIEKGEYLTQEQRIRLLTNYIGGFEKWSELNEDCRLHIVHYMDYESRCKLERCSKQDQATVKSTPIHVHNMAIFDYDKLPDSYNVEPFNNVQVDLEFGNRIRKYRLTFSQDGGDIKRQWLKNLRGLGIKVQTLIIKSTNYYEEAVKFAEGFMKKGNFELDKLGINMRKYPMETSQIRTLPVCKGALIKMYNIEYVHWWLSRLPVNMNCIQFWPGDEEFIITSESLDVPQVRSVKTLVIDGDAGCTHEQFMNLRNASMRFASIEISDETINQFIKRWVNGKCYEQFKAADIVLRNNYNVDVILRGINATEWNDAFRQEESHFCAEFRDFYGYGESYQIPSIPNPFNSLTLNFYSFRCVRIYHTGVEKTDRFNEKYTEYLIPYIRWIFRWRFE